MLAAIVVLALLFVACSAVTVRLFVSPGLPPVPDSVDAIIELGGPTNRDATTLALAGSHVAPLVVQSTTEHETVTQHCLPPTPGVEVACFHADPPTTRGEARWIGAAGRRLGWRSVLLVTTPDHAWRARLRVMRCFAGDVYVSTSPLPAHLWPRQIAYQWAASAKALLLQREC